MAEKKTKLAEIKTKPTAASVEDLSVKLSRVRTGGIETRFFKVSECYYSAMEEK
jgi:hypothetical protein